MVVIEQSAQPLAADHAAGPLPHFVARLDDPMIETLVITLGKKISEELVSPVA